MKIKNIKLCLLGATVVFIIAFMLSFFYSGVEDNIWEYSKKDSLISGNITSEELETYNKVNDEIYKNIDYVELFYLENLLEAVSICILLGVSIVASLLVKLFPLSYVDLIQHEINDKQNIYLAKCFSCGTLYKFEKNTKGVTYVNCPNCGKYGIVR